MSARPLVAALLGAALLPLAATAATAAPHHDAGTLRQAGVRLTWPLRSPRVALAPGTAVKVKVTSLRPGSPRVTVTLTRTDGRDGARIVKRRSLRAGTFSATLPRAVGARYELSVRRGRHTYRRATILTPKPVAPKVPAPKSAPTPTAPTPTPAPTTPTPPAPDLPFRGFGPFPLPEGCPAGQAPGATVTFDRTEVPNGQPLVITVTNSGDTCLSIDGSAHVAGSLGGSIVSATVPLPDEGRSLPGETRTFTWTVPDVGTLPPGRYTMTVFVTPPSTSDAIASYAVRGEFDVIPPLPE